jgi:hypothetical protein
MNFRTIFIFLILFSFGTMSCHLDRPKHHYKKYRNKTVSKDTLIITKRAAISVWLDTPTLEKRRKQYGDDDFETGADDYVYYSSISDSVLKSKKLPVITVKHSKYLKFVQNNGAITLINLDTIQPLYSLYFFVPTKVPLNADITNTASEYERYFH